MKWKVCMANIITVTTITAVTCCLLHPVTGLAGEEDPGGKAPHDIPLTDKEMGAVTEEARILTLEEALSLAERNNPDLKTYAIEVRVSGQRVLQEGLIPNPDLEFEVENFGGTGEFGGFDNAETTLSISQLFELGGKRGKRKRFVGFEGDRADWDLKTR